MGEEERDEQQRVFGPLVQPEGFDPALERVGAVVEAGGGYGSGAFESRAQSAVGVGDHGVLAGGQKLGVRAGVADVAEALAELLAQDGELANARDVGGSVGGDHAGEDAEVVGHALCYGAVQRWPG